jgi:hypothetical protein
MLFRTAGAVKGECCKCQRKVRSSGFGKVRCSGFGPGVSGAAHAVLRLHIRSPVEQQAHHFGMFHF